MTDKPITLYPGKRKPKQQTSSDKLFEVLSRLEKVRENTNGGYTACCPSHSDVHPSLAVRETQDGKILIKCFSGCELQTIVSAIGLQLSDLFPDTREHVVKSERRPFRADDILKLLAYEATIVDICARWLRDGYELTDEEYGRLEKAIERIQDAAMMVGWGDDERRK